MQRDVTDGARAASRLADLVRAYALRVSPAILEQHDTDSVSSPLGVWLLLAACAAAAEGDELHALEDALGCDALESRALLHALLAHPPAALKTAIAVWTSFWDFTPSVAAWLRELPAQVQSGSMPTQAEADEWVTLATDGQLETFPLDLASARIVLASALAVDVSWSVPLRVVPADEHLRTQSPWRDTVRWVLWDDKPAMRAALVRTQAAGIVAVHQAEAAEGVRVLSVSADPCVSRDAVFEAALEVASHLADQTTLSGCSMYGFEAGAGHSWEIVEREARTVSAGQHVERIIGASLPAWRIESELDLKCSEVFGALAGLSTLRRLVSADPADQDAARQVVVAEFTSHGFHAAAVTVLGALRALRRDPQQQGIERVATLYFDHPYAVIAIAGKSRAVGEPAADAPYAGLPVFSAWIDCPTDPIPGRPGA